MQAKRDDEHSYTEIIDVIRAKCENFIDDARQLWRRLVFNHLITNVDDHLQNIGFLYSGNNLWRLSPAFDLNPFPDKSPESKTWLSEDSGPITSIEQLMGQAGRFELSQATPLTIDHAAAVSVTSATVPSLKSAHHWPVYAGCRVAGICRSLTSGPAGCHEIKVEQLGGREPGFLQSLTDPHEDVSIHRGVWDELTTQHTSQHLIRLFETPLQIDHITVMSHKGVVARIEDAAWIMRHPSPDSRQRNHQNEAPASLIHFRVREQNEEMLSIRVAYGARRNEQCCPPERKKPTHSPAKRRSISCSD